MPPLKSITFRLSLLFQTPANRCLRAGGRRQRSGPADLQPTQFQGRSEPEFCLKIGRRKRPTSHRVWERPMNPPVVPRNCVGNPMACIRMRPNRGIVQTRSRKPIGKNKSIMTLPSARAKSRAANPRVLSEISIDRRIVGVNSPTPYVAISIRNQGIVAQRRACPITTRKKDRQTTLRVEPELRVSRARSEYHSN